MSLTWFDVNIFDWWIIIQTYILMNMMLHDVVRNWWIIIWMYILMNMMLHDVVHNWWIMKLWCEVVVVGVAAVVANVVKVVSCCRCRWSCWSLLHLLLSPRIIIHIKLGGLMPCWMYSLMPCWMLDHSYHVESLCPISWESMLYKLGAWCPDWYHMHSALSSWCCCRWCWVVGVVVVLSSCRNN